MMNTRCPSCGLVNFSTAEDCKRCGTLLTVAHSAGFESGQDERVAEAEEPKPRRSLKKKLLVGFVSAGFLIFVWYLSLIETSTAATYEEKRAVHRAIDLIEEKGFIRDAFLLRRLANYRTSDNWWNAYVGHADAYAATNFPFQIITLYPEYFTFPKDDTERALILLHEARHLAGAGEEEACRSVWQDKAKLGYTQDKYFGTRVWTNVTEYTMRHAPDMFRCGPDRQSDCAAEGLRASR